MSLNRSSQFFQVPIEAYKERVRRATARTSLRVTARTERKGPPLPSYFPQSLHVSLISPTYSFIFLPHLPYIPFLQVAPRFEWWLAPLELIWRNLTEILHEIFLHISHIFLHISHVFLHISYISLHISLIFPTYSFIFFSRIPKSLKSGGGSEILILV